jgi:hypothetical protein
MSSNGKADFHRVIFSESQRKMLRRWAAHAHTLRLGQRYRNSLLSMLKSLENDPTGWGEYKGTNKVLHLDIYEGFTEFLLIMYGVHRKRKLVFIQDIQLRSSLGFPDTLD